jgi:hypothetical protein
MTTTKYMLRIFRIGDNFKTKVVFDISFNTSLKNFSLLFFLFFV